MSVVIKLENVSKQYRLGLIGTNTLKGDLQRWWYNVRGLPDPTLMIGQENNLSTSTSTLTSNDFVWALKDINFEVQQGEVLGIIGKNGAGKSTLLKLLSRVTSPTTGLIKAKGRIASLLEVGTGFHPELTGKENIFLNGAILGMTKTEIRSKLDEIVEFAGVAKYIDTPVKRYSSGMYVRLAFAVAAHLDPDILIVDEVLSVGDAEFQKKAIGKMQNVSSKDGRTVLFVSHNMGSVKSLCKNGIVLKNGIISFHGGIEEVVNFYLKGNSVTQNRRKFRDIENRKFSLEEISLNPTNGTSDDVLDEYQEIQLRTKIKIHRDEEILHVTYVLKNENGDAIFTFSHRSMNIPLKMGLNELICTFPKGFLNFGTYYLDFYIIEKSRATIYFEKDILSFEVQIGKRQIGAWTGKEPGFIKPLFKWVNNEV